MRILHLEASPGWGGQEIRVLREAEGMRARGHTVFLAVMRGGVLIPEARKAGFLVYAVNFKKMGWIFALVQLLWIIWRHRIDLVNTHSSLDAWIGGIAARLIRCKIIRTRHLSTPIKGGFNSRILYGKLADFVVTTSCSIIPMICEQSGKSREQCRSIVTGVDPKKVVVVPGEAEAFRESLGIESKDFLVGTVCFMRSWKGIGDFLKAASLLRNVPHLKWVIVGGGHESTYRREAQKMNLENVVFFTGHLDRPFPAIAALDLFTLLSTANEGVSQAILQAAFLEKPLLATPVGGLSEVCLHRVTGVQIAPFSPDQVASAVLELKENRPLCKELGVRAKQLVEKRFLFSHTLNQMEEVIEKLYEKR